MFFFLATNYSKCFVLDFVQIYVCRGVSDMTSLVMKVKLIKSSLKLQPIVYLERLLFFLCVYNG